MSRRICLLAWGSIAALIGGAALAQNVPAQFVVTGKAAEDIQDFTTINLATAERIAEACQKAATTEGVQVTVTVLDGDGNYVYMDRMDGQGYFAVITSEMKARTALAVRAPSKVQMNRVTESPEAEFRQIQMGLFPNSGGLPILVNKQLIGVIGVGGSTPRLAQGWSDEICAHKAMVEVIGPTVPPLGQDLPRRVAMPPANPAPVARFALPANVTPKSTLPAEFVVSGKGAATIYDGNQISLAAAKKIARVCRDWVQARNETMSLFIVDTAGQLVHAERMDGQSALSVRMALMKAQSALKTRQPTSISNAQLRNDPSGMARSALWFNIMSLRGGVPIVVDGQMIGAIGVGGAHEDEDCAVAGLKAAFGDRVTVPVYPAPAGGAAPAGRAG